MRSPSLEMPWCVNQSAFEPRLERLRETALPDDWRTGAANDRSSSVYVLPATEPAADAVADTADPAAATAEPATEAVVLAMPLTAPLFCFHVK